MMSREDAIKAIQKEMICIKRQDTPDCCRKEFGCGACDLVFESEYILEAYRVAILALIECIVRRADANSLITSPEKAYLDFVDNCLMEGEKDV